MSSDYEAILSPIDYNATGDPAEARMRFLAQVKEALNYVRSNPEMDTPETQHDLLENFYRTFFQYVTGWAMAERANYANVKNHASAERLKEGAAQVREDLQERLIDFAQCYISINRSLGIAGHSIKKYEGRTKSGDQNIEWSSATSKMLKDHQEERRALLNSNKLLAIAMQAFGKFESAYGSLDEQTEGIFGKSGVNDVLRPIRSALRVTDFAKAKSLVSKIQPPKKMFSLDKKGNQQDFDGYKDALQAYISMIEQNQEQLTIEENKLYLTPGEVKVVLITQMKELTLKEAFLDKYFLPYIKHSIKGFNHLQEKLLVAGSLEHFVTLYIKLMSGIARPLVEEKHVREYESEVLDKVKYLMNTQFMEIEKINAINSDDLKNFMENLSGFTEVVKQNEAA